MQFSLWDASGTGSPPTSGTQAGGTQTLPGVTVTNGLFTVVLNAGSEFGGAAFTGEARWLQVAVLCPAGSGSYAAPYALRRISTPIAENKAVAVSVGSTHVAESGEMPMRRRRN